MIKVIAFDLIGVLAGEKPIELTPEEDKLERLFGPNKSDDEFLHLAQDRIGEDKPIYDMAQEIISKLYRVRQENVFEKIKELYPDIKIVIATNHISFVRKFIEESFNMELLDDIIISAEIGRIKPNPNFYKYILKKYHIKADELLFLDDNRDNVDGADSIHIHTIKVEREMDLVDEIVHFLNIIHFDR